MKLAPMREPQIVRTEKKIIILLKAGFISLPKPMAPLRLKNINANIFVATAFFEDIPSIIRRGTVIREVPPEVTLKTVIRKERKQTVKIPIGSIV